MMEPIDHDIWMVAVVAARREIGTTSEAYAGELAMKRPQGTPSNAWPMVRTSRESACYSSVRRYMCHCLEDGVLTKKEMKMVAFINTRPKRVVHR